MPDQRPGRREHLRSGPQPAGEQDRRGRLQAIEQQGGRGRGPCRRRGGRWSRRYCPSRCRECRPCPQAASAPARTGSTRTDSPTARRRSVRRTSTPLVANGAAPQQSHPCGAPSARAKRQTHEFRRADPVLRFRRWRAVGAAADTRAAAPGADRLCRGQCRLSLWRAHRGRHRVARPGAARAAGRALPTAPGRDRLQHRLDHCARHGALGARTCRWSARSRRSSRPPNCRRTG